MNKEKKLVVITGAAGGMGLEYIKQFSEQGYPLLLLDMNIESIKHMASKNILVNKVDVGDFESFKESIESAEKTFGKTDLIINNAGIMMLGDMTKQDPKEWSTMINVNILGVLNGTKIVLENMISQNSGTIINISSIAGFKPFNNHAAYCATKYAVHGLTETIRQEVSGSNVRVLLISPGAVETKLLDRTTDKSIIDGYQDWKTTMGGKVVDPAEVVKTALFMYQMPQEISVREVVIATTKQDL